jgi:AcrR family transcriptional regulator
MTRPHVEAPRASLAERRRLRRGELLDAAIDVIRREGADVTMEEMATAGGISKPILYRHFVDRDGLVAAVTERALDEIGDLLDIKIAEARADEPPHSIRATIDAFFEYVERDPQLYRFIVNNDAKRANLATVAFVDRISERVADTLGEGLADRGLDPSPATIWGRAIVGMVQATAAWWISGAEVDRSRAVDTLTDLVWVGIVGSVSEPSAPAPSS